MKDKRRKNPELFLDYLIRSVPRFNPPLFFATRVAHNAELEPPNVLFWLQRFAKRLVPVMTGLGVLAMLASYQLTSFEEEPVPYAELLIDQESFDDPITTDYVLDTLRPISTEE
jgi:hypothetical protein